MDCCLDESGRAEDVGIDRDVRQARLQRLQRLVDPARDLKRVAPRKFLDHQQQAGMAIDDGVADQRLMVLLHLGDIAEREVLVVLDPHLRDIGRLMIGRTLRTPSL